MTCLPISMNKMVRIFIRMTVTRNVNRISGSFSALFKRKKKKRVASSRKKYGSGLFLVFLLFSLTITAMNISVTFVENLAGELDKNVSVNATLSEESTRSNPDINFSGSGSSVRFWPSPDLWPMPENETAILMGIGIISAMVFFAIFFLSLGKSTVNLSQVGWDFEWLATFPATSETIFILKSMEYSVNIAAFLILFPFFTTIFWSSGYLWKSVFPAFAMTIYLCILLSCLRIFFETWTRMSFNQKQINNIQAMCTIIGTLSLFFAMVPAYSPHLPDWFFKWTLSAPSAILYLPSSVPALLCRETLSLNIVGVLFMGVLVEYLCIKASARLVRNGFISESRPGTGKSLTSKKTNRKKMKSRLVKGVAWMELKLIMRDRNLMVQIFVVPFFVVGLNMIVIEGAFDSIVTNFRYAATTSFIISAYAMLYGAFSILNIERQSLWLLFTFNKPIDSILMRKTIIWCGVYLIYPIAILILAACLNPHPNMTMLADASMVIAGVIIHVFIAAGLGIFATDPLEIEPQKRMSLGYSYLFVIFSGMFLQAIYTSSAWTKTGQIILSTFLALSIWQKVRDRTPFLLSPSQKPKPELEMSDGMFAAIAFFTINGLSLTIVSFINDLPVGPREYVIAYFIAGVLVAPMTLYILWRNRMKNLFRQLGIRRNDIGMKFYTAVFKGVQWGVCAGVIGLAYLWLLRNVDVFQSYKNDIMPQASVWLRDSPILMILLIVIVAPLFEEFLFRGLLFRGMLRTLPCWAATVASSAIFAFVHPPISVLPVFVLGIATAISFHRTRWLVCPIATHMVYNAIIVINNLYGFH